MLTGLSPLFTWPGGWCRFRPRCLGAFLLLVIGLAVQPSLAQAPKPAADEQTPQVRLFLDLLADKEVQAWIEKQRAAEKAKPKAPAANDGGLAGEIATHVGKLQKTFEALIAAIPTVPAELARAYARLQAEMGAGPARVLLLVVGFLVIGAGVEWLAVAAARNMRAVGSGVAEPASVQERLRRIGTRLVSGLSRALAFAFGSIGTFLVFDWPPLLREVVLAYLLAVVALRLAIVAVRLLFAPDAEPLRVLPMDTVSARFWQRRIIALAAWFALGYATLETFRSLGVAFPVVRLIGLTLIVGLLAIGIEMVWRRPRAGRDTSHDAASGAIRAVRTNVLLSIFFVLLWVLRIIGTFGLFWLLVVLVAVPWGIGLTRRAVNHLLRPPPGAGAAAPVSHVSVVVVERGMRVLWIVGAILLLAHVWDLDFSEMAAGGSVTARLAHGALNAVVILLVADFGWQLLRAAIDDRLVLARDPGEPNTEEARRRARMRTLLPIMKNILFIVFIVMAALMALAALGVEIGPLIAGAGVVGVAIGFGAQTIVRDIIAGMFYLLDDAFRVGEYIQSGSYKGTVESFSLRSVKLRHQRGPLFTVPFGTLGAVQNMSRDWVIDKMMIGITYDSDIDLAKKLIKKVGKELTEIPEFAPSILEPLKMQGVENFADFAIQIRLKIKTRPGEQFMIRRRAFAMIKKAFDENGVKFAFPTVQVAGGDANAAAVAQASLQAMKPPDAQAAG